MGHDEDWSSGVNNRARNFPTLLTAVFPAITDAPVRVNGRAFDNVFETWIDLIANLKHYYLKESMYQVYKIIGSLEIFGNPVMAVNSFMKGARDLIVPFREFLKSPNNPSRLGIGVAKGTLSLFSHFFTGVFGFVSNISQAVGTAAATLSLDEQYKRWHHQQAADHIRYMTGQFRPKGCELVLSAVARPVQDITAGLLFAASGLIVEPFKGAQVRGMAGFARGIGIGTVGVVAKPLVGVFDAFAHVSESIHDVARSANVFDKKLHYRKKMRLPYVFGIQKLLLSYNSIDAYSANLLRLFPIKEYKRAQVNSDETLVLSELLQLKKGIGTYIVVTTRRIAKFDVKYDGSTAPIRTGQIELNDKERLVSTVHNYSHNRSKLYITRRSAQNNHDTSPTRDNYVGLTDVGHKSQEKSALSSFEDTSLKNRNYLNMSRSKELKNNPVQHALEALGTTRPKKQEKIPVFDVEGEFQHRVELTRIHNAFCCLTSQFSFLLDDINGSGDSGNTEGLTSFGPLHFEEEEANATVCNDNDSDINLDAIPWINNFEQPNYWEDQHETFYTKGSKLSADEGGAESISVIEARAREIALLPLSPSPHNKAVEAKGATDTRNVVPIHSIGQSQHEMEIGNRNDDIQNSINRLDVIFDDEEGGSNLITSGTSMEERLGKVESMLQQVIKAQSGASTQQSRAFFPTSNTSMVSTLTDVGDHILAHAAALNYPASIEGETENAKLKREIDLLRKELAETRAKGPWGREDVLSRTSTHESKKIRKRRFKKVWKS